MERVPVVAILMGSQSDLPTLEKAGEALQRFDIGFEMNVLSAHRAPDEVANFAKQARKRGIRVVIAGAGGAAHLPGMVAAYTELPVIGVPVANGPLQGQDALLSIVQMPTGVPVATVAIGNAWNAGILAVQMLALADENLAGLLKEYKDELRQKVVENQSVPFSKR